MTGGEPITFMSLPAELRNRIYDLSGCIKLYQCRLCSTTVFGDSNRVTHQQLTDKSTPIRKRYSWPWIDIWCCKRGKRSGDCGHAHRITILWINRQDEVNPHHKCKCSGSPPHQQRSKDSSHLAIAQVSKSVRLETLGIYYASYEFFGTMFEPSRDRAGIMKWLKAIGPDNAAQITSLRIVYSRKQYLRFMKQKMIGKMREMGLRVDDGVVEAVRLKAPYCRCEWCVMQTLREKNRDTTNHPQTYKFCAYDC